MSRIGSKPINIPSGVKVSLSGNTVTVEGPKGKLSREVHSLASVVIDGDVITTERKNESINARSIHGLTRTLIANMVEGVTEGFVKKLEIVGVGYRAQMKGNNLDLSLGFSHPVVVEPPAGIEFAVEGPTKIAVKGINKELVGQVAADIRKIRKPEPYKGKGVRYEGEYILRKAGKAGKK